MIHFLLLLNKQCKVRLSKWYSTYTAKEREKIIREVGFEVTQRASDMCNFIDWRDMIIVYKRYASLYFIVCTDRADNELLTLETVHRFVFVLDKYFGSVTELDIIFDFSRVRPSQIVSLHQSSDLSLLPFSISTNTNTNHIANSSITHLGILSIG